MTLNTRYTREELKNAWHPCLPFGGEYSIRRYEIEFAPFPPHEPDGITLDVESTCGQRLVLRFSAPESDFISSIRWPSEHELGPLYVIDKSEDAYEDSRRIEVGCNEASSEPMFWASDVFVETSNTNECYVYFAFDGDDFRPSDITTTLAITPTSISQKGERSVEKMLPRYSSWRLSTEPIIDERIDVDAMASTLIQKLEPKVQQINEVRRRFNVTTHLE
nr:DUF4279 domain-containing protein [Gammaproteobacteria bacterium]